MFVLKQLVRDQITYHKNRYHSEPEIIEIQEDEFADKVSLYFDCQLCCLDWIFLRKNILFYFLFFFFFFFFFFF